MYALEQALRAQQTARSGNAMTIDGKPGIEINNGGGLTINDGGSLNMTTSTGTIVLSGRRRDIPDGSGRVQQGFTLARDDGTVAFYVLDLGIVPGHTHQQSWALLDRAGNVIVAEDTVSGHGIATPYIPAGFFADITPPTATTTSTLFTAMQWADSYQQHPKLTASVLVLTPAGTTGQIRMTVGGSQIGSTVTVPSGTNGQLTIPAGAWPGTFVFGQRLTVQLEARVTGGTGSIGVRALGLWGVQT